MPHGFTHFWVSHGGEWGVRKDIVFRDTWEGVVGWLDRVVNGERLRT